MKCEHLNFYSSVAVNRLTDGDGGEVKDYSADITIKCADCGLPFRFKGLPGGLNFSGPTASADLVEARMPIEPAPKEFLS